MHCAGRQVDLGVLAPAVVAGARETGWDAIAPALHDICELLGTAPGPDAAADAMRLIADIMAGRPGAHLSVNAGWSCVQPYTMAGHTACLVTTACRLQTNLHDLFDSCTQSVHR